MIALMAIAGLWTLVQLPGDAQVPIHFSAKGVADGWARPWIGLFVAPAIAAVIWTIQVLLPRIDPRGQNLARSATAFGTIWLAITAFMTIVQAITISAALGAEFNRGRLFVLMVAGLLIVVGNVMGKLRWNYTVGIRTPWTLADERVWDKTHRFGGRALVLVGVFLLLAAFVPTTQGKLGVLVTITTVGTCLAIVAKSYLFWRTES
jgi:uncharacterized membrane protein